MNFCEERTQLTLQVMTDIHAHIPPFTAVVQTYGCGCEAQIVMVLIQRIQITQKSKAPFHILGLHQVSMSNLEASERESDLEEEWSVAHTGSNATDTKLQILPSKNLKSLNKRPQ